jgi:hypothetical protein
VATFRADDAVLESVVGALAVFSTPRIIGLPVSADV